MCERERERYLKSGKYNESESLKLFKQLIFIYTHSLDMDEAWELSV